MKIIRAIIVLAALAAFSARAEDPVDQEVSPAVKALRKEAAHDDAASRTPDQQISPEVKSLDRAGAKEDSTSWKNLQSFIREKVREGLRGRALGQAVKQERERLGLTGDKNKVKLMMEYEQNQEKLEKIDTEISSVKSRMGSGNPFAANTGANNSNIRKNMQEKTKKLEETKKMLEQRSEEILNSLDAGSRF